MAELDSLLAFARVAEAGSFSGAAAQLGRSKSAVSKQIARLEDRLGARLLHRTTRRLSLTEAGETLYARARRIAEDVAEAEAAVGSLQAAPQGRLAVNAPLSFGFGHIAPLMPAFLRAHPGVSVDLSLDDRRVDLVAEGFDMGLRIAEALPDSSYIARRLADGAVHIVAAPAYLAAAGRPETPGDLAHHACLAYRYRAGGRRWHLRDAAGQRYDVAVGGRFTANNGDALRAAALGGAGLALLPDFLCGADLAAGRLAAVLESYTAGNRLGAYAMYPEGRHLSPKVRAFVDFLADRLAGSRLDSLPHPGDALG